MFGSLHLPRQYRPAFDCRAMWKFTWRAIRGTGREYFDSHPELNDWIAVAAFFRYSADGTNHCFENHKHRNPYLNSEE